MEQAKDCERSTGSLPVRTEPGWPNETGNYEKRTAEIDDMEASHELESDGKQGHAAGGIPIRPRNIVQETPSGSSSDAGLPHSSPGRVYKSLSSEVLSQPPLHIVLPSSSLIFERDVQEDIQPMQTSPSIPSHIITENHIPPALEASSAAITDDLDPDMVEIVTHSAHQPAATNVSGNITTEHSLSSSFFEDGRLQSEDGEDATSTHKAPDPVDVRRLSFISFADVVNAEHAEANELATSRDCFPVASFSSNSAVQNRSPSPLRSPTSSHGFGTSPPTSIAPSFKGLDFSPTRTGFMPGSPPLTSQRPASPTTGNELNVETMRQALRKTGSSDVITGRSRLPSPVGNEDV